MIKAGEELLRLQAENQKLRKELAEYKEFLDLETLEIYTENKRLKEGIKQASEEIQKYVGMLSDDTVADVNMKSGLGLALEKIDKLIESEG